MGVNGALKARTEELGLTQFELAHRLNAAIEELTGRYGTLSERTIYDMLSGRTRWPQEKQRRDLEAVFGCTAEELGFRPNGKPHPTPEPEKPVRRRNFLTSTAITAATSAMPTLAAAPAVGASDVARMNRHVDQLVSIDNKRGGNGALETAALGAVSEVQKLLQRSCSEKTRQSLYSLAAEFTSTAAFACIDSFALSRAHHHLNSSAMLAGLAQDSVAELRVWNLRSILATYQGNPHDSVAASQAGQRLTAARRDPFLDSLIKVCAASGYAKLNDRQSALSQLDKATDLLTKVRDESRPSWTDFFGLGQIEVVATKAYIHFNQPEDAEAAAFRALSATPPVFRRNQAQISMYLATAQLNQGDVKEACSSAHRAIDLMEGDPLPGRMRTSLGDFHRSLVSSPFEDSATAQWVQRAKSEWNREV